MQWLKVMCSRQHYDLEKNGKQVTDVISDLANVATKVKQTLLPY